MAGIGFVGLGIMGSRMAVNLLQAGYDLTVYNRSPEKAEPLAAKGARVAGSPGECMAGSDICFFMVTGQEALESLIFGENGAAEGLSAGKRLVNMSSVTPAYSESLAGRVQALGAEFLDAPVSGTRKPAEDGTLLVLASGDESQVEAVREYFEVMGKKAVYCGPAGRGSMMKMMINLLLGVMMSGLSEALMFGRKGGLEMEDMLEVVLNGPLANLLFETKSAMIRQEEYPVNFPLKHMAKDMKYIIDTAHENMAHVPGAHSALTLYDLARGLGMGDEDFAAVARMFPR